MLLIIPVDICDAMDPATYDEEEEDPNRLEDDPKLHLDLSQGVWLTYIEPSIVSRLIKKREGGRISQTSIKQLFPLTL